MSYSPSSSVAKNGAKNNVAQKTPHDKSARILDELTQIIKVRAQENNPASSWTATLLAKGKPAIAQKLGEEAIETIIAALDDKGKDKNALIHESADLLYHLLVLWHACDIDPHEVWHCLEGRKQTSGIQEKEGRHDK